MTIQYSDLGNRVQVRNNKASVLNQLNTFASTLVGIMNSQVTIDPATPPVPKTVNGVQTVFYTQPTPASVVYTPGNGAYPEGKIHLAFSSPDQSTDFYFDVNVTFWDDTHFTISLDGAPFVRALVNTSGTLNMVALRVFTYGVVGAFPLLCDKVSNFNYNGISAVG